MKALILKTKEHIAESSRTTLQQTACPGTTTPYADYHSKCVRSSLAAKHTGQRQCDSHPCTLIIGEDITDNE